MIRTMAAREGVSSDRILATVMSICYAMDEALEDVAREREMRW
ncbi:MAG: hypothetical protein V2A76_09255 [Planctomycetota bacterium]